jgi:hypothetical protein
VPAYLNGKEIPPEAYEALEKLLGRPVLANERISILTSKLDENPPAEVRQAALNDLRALWARADEKTKDIPEEEWEEIVDEAMRSVRPSYRRIS